MAKIFSKSGIKAQLSETIRILRWNNSTITHLTSSKTKTSNPQKSKNLSPTTPSANNKLTNSLSPTNKWDKLPTPIRTEPNHNSSIRARASKTTCSSKMKKKFTISTMGMRWSSRRAQWTWKSWNNKRGSYLMIELWS